MKYPPRTKQGLIEEISISQRSIQILERPEAKCTKNNPVCSFLFIFTIAAIFFVGGLTSGYGNAASSPQTICVGSELDFPPYAFLDENEQPAGFSIDLIKAVARAMSLSINISTGTWDKVWNSLVLHQLDVLPIVAKLPERQRLADFSLPHTETFDAFFVRQGDPAIPSILSAQGKEIVVMRSDAAHHALLERNFQGKLFFVDTISAGLKLISSGKHNAFLCSKLSGTLAIKRHGITGLAAGPLVPDYKRVFSFAVRKGDTELLEKLNQGLLIVKTNGEYDRIYKRWLSFDDPWQRVKQYFLPVIIIAMAAILIALSWLFMLKRLVKKLNHEIFKRQQTEEVLRLQSEIAAHMAEGINLVRKSDGKIIFTNPKFEEMFGYNHGELIGQHISVINSKVEKKRAIIAQEIITALEQAGSWEGEIYNIKKNGTPFWCNTNISKFNHPEHGQVFISVHTDITERKQIKEKLLESEGKFRALIESSSDWIFMLDRQGAYLLSNDSVGQFGFKGAEPLIGRRLEDIYPSEVLEIYKAKLEEVFTTGKALKFEYVMPETDGSHYHLDTIFPIYKGKKVFAAGGICHDITEQKRAEEELKKKESFNYALFEYNPEQAIAVDLEGRIIAFNRAKRLSGDRLPDIGGVMYRDYASSHKIDLYTEMMECIASGKIKVFPEQKYREKFLSISIAPFSQGAVIISQDITESKKVESALQKNRMDLIAIIDNLPFMAWMKDSEGRFLAVNEPFAHSCELPSANDLIGKTDFDVWPEKLAEAYRADDNEVMLSGKRKTIEEPISYQGLEKWFETYKAPLYDADGNITGTTGFARDITERKLAEDKIKAALLEKETMLSEIYHRVKNNMQVISSLLNMQSSYLRDEAAKAALQDSVNRVKTMANIHNLLYHSDDVAKIDMDNFISDLISNLQQSYQIAGTAIDIHVDSTDVALDLGQALPCGLILNELVSNALNHAFPQEKKGKITVTMRSRDNDIALTVQDNGIGFSEPFDAEYHSSMGLELVNILVDQLEGKIDKQISGGTIWTIVFSGREDRKWRNG